MSQLIVSIRTASGAKKLLPANLDVTRVVGLDADGRIVVDDHNARNAAANTNPYVFALTLCCNASDKGVEDGIVCRGCYSDTETGVYLYRAADGTFPGLDPLTGIRATREAYDTDVLLAARDHLSVKLYPRSVAIGCRRDAGLEGRDAVIDAHVRGTTAVPAPAGA